MALLIDGYNLLHASGVFPARHLPGTLHHARTALLDELASMLPERELRQTVIVFDSAEAPPGLPNRLDFQGIDVRFASNHADADELIEILIDESLSPRELIVVSSDHRLHRAARRRGATAIDSDIWFVGLQALQQTLEDERATAKPQHPLSENEIHHWLKVFGDHAGQGGAGSEARAQPLAEQSENAPAKVPGPNDPNRDLPLETNAGGESDSELPESGVYNPFPPGYADDLFEEE